MANYHLEVSIISRGHGRFITKAISYISGEKLRDNYNSRTCYSHRQDVLFCKIFQPDKAPPDFYKLQILCDEIDKAERRYDARTAREFKGSLPNELPTHELIQIVNEYIFNNFVNHGLCAIAAIHEGRNENDPSKNNPHVHIIVPTRSVGTDGFSKKKTVSGIIKNILAYGGNNGQPYRIVPTSETAWIYVSAMRVLKYRTKETVSLPYI